MPHDVKFAGFDHTLHLVIPHLESLAAQREADIAPHAACSLAGAEQIRIAMIYGNHSVAYLRRLLDFTFVRRESDAPPSRES